MALTSLAAAAYAASLTGIVLVAHSPALLAQGAIATAVLKAILVSTLAVSAAHLLAVAMAPLASGSRCARRLYAWKAAARDVTTAAAAAASSLLDAGAGAVPQRTISGPSTAPRQHISRGIIVPHSAGGAGAADRCEAVDSCSHIELPPLRPSAAPAGPSAVGADAV